MGILSVSLVMRVLHECVIFEDALPILFIFAVCSTLACKLLDSDLMTVEVLKNKVIEECSFIIFSELDFNIGLARSL